MKLSIIRIFLLRLLFFLFLWTVLSAADFAEFIMVVCIVLLATLTSMYVMPRGFWSLRPVACLRFIPYFLCHSLMGGWDVAKRALRPSMPLSPGIIEFKTDASESQKALFAWCISLLPGTATIAIKEHSLSVHVLDRSLDVESSLHELEAKIKTSC
jgi:multicomponent Na+:H+ antiporter subunit E